MEKESLQHVQLPNDMGVADLDPKDQVIYLTIKRFSNINNNCYPSLKTISMKSGASINTVRKSIDRLVEKKYITTKKKGKSIYYEFNPYKEFEPFSYEFLDKNELSFTTKAYLVASQQYMFKNIEGFGEISYSNRDLSKLINMPESTIRKCNIELESLKYLSIVDNNKIDKMTGCRNQTKVFELSQLGQAIVWKLGDHEDRLSDLEKKLQSQQKLIEQLLQKVEDERSSQMNKSYPL